MQKIDNPKNNYKNVAHAFFLSLAITIAEPSTILPLIVEHFSESMVIVGLFVSLLRGGSIVIQLYVAFHAQAYRRVLPYLSKVFFFRWFAWLSIGLSIYFKELQAKIFSKKYRGKTMANRQVAGSIASIISGGVAGYVLSHYEAPLNYAYLFMVSSFIMGIGFLLFSTIDEPAKEHIQAKEKHFGLFLKNALATLKSDKRLQRQIVVIFLSFSYYLSMPFVILHANSSFVLSGWMLGGFIMVQMLGSIIGSSLLWRRISNYEKMLTLSFIFMILAFVLALFANSIWLYGVIFFLFGMGLDGLSISGMNLVIEIAPEEKRPIYTALQTNITSLGLFFPVLGGLILKYSASYAIVYGLTIALLTLGFILSLSLKGAAYED